MVLLWLSGSKSLMAFGATNVEVNMKNMSNRNTRSDMDAMLNEMLRLFLICMAI
jgi:hypothetical protein